VGEKMNACRAVLGTPLGNCVLQKLRRIWEDVSKMNLRETGYEDEKWRTSSIFLCQNYLLSFTFNLLVPLP
jgi:hypothetical protein